MKMKRYYLLVLLLGLFNCLPSEAQISVSVYQKNGTVNIFNNVDKIVCSGETQDIYVDGEKISSQSVSQIDSVLYDDLKMEDQKVDLGLSVKWAAWNVGATRPEEYGNYYYWGDLKAWDGDAFYYYPYYDEEKQEYIFIGDDISGTQYDAARAEWGGSWRMPTLAEFNELIEKCKWRRVVYNGIAGQQAIGPNGNSIFFPAAGYAQGEYLNSQALDGYYWTSTLYETKSYFYYVYGVIFSSDSGGRTFRYGRNYYFSIRPVSD